MSQFSVAQVKARALELLVKHNNVPDEMKTFYHGTILDWSDFFNENYTDKSTSAEAKKLWNDIAQLWIDLAGLLATLRQFKQAVQVYEDGEYACLNLCSLLLMDNFSSEGPYCCE